MGCSDLQNRRRLAPELSSLQLQCRRFTVSVCIAKSDRTSFCSSSQPVNKFSRVMDQTVVGIYLKEAEDRPSGW